MKLRPSFICALVGLLAVVGCGSQKELYRMTPNTTLSKMGRAPITDTLDHELLSDLVVSYINLYRAKFHLGKLTQSGEATRAAYWMADYQRQIQLVTHVTTVPGMSLFPERYRNSGGQSYAYGVENAGWASIIEVHEERNRTYDELARRIVDNWINSPDHRKNLLATADESYGIVGLGISRGALNGFDGVYATMDAFFIWPGAAMGFTANSGE